MVWTQAIVQMPLILARDEAEDLIKIIFGAIFVAIWVIGALLSGTKKKKPTPQQERSWEDILRDLAGEKPKERSPQQRPQASPPPLPRQTPPPMPTQSAPRPQRKKVRPKPLRQPAQDVRLPAPSLPTSEPEPIVSRSSRVDQTRPPDDIIATEIGKGGDLARSQRAPSRAQEVARFLDPANLRSEFILTEVLQPPLALREQTGR